MYPRQALLEPPASGVYVPPRYIQRPADVEEVLRTSGLLPRVQEGFFVFPLDPGFNLIGEPVLVGLGTVDRVLAMPCDVFREPIIRGALYVILCHNHVVNDPLTPSPDDLRCTRGLIKAGKVLSLHVVDHVIVSNFRPGDVYSMREKGDCVFHGDNFP